MKRLLDLLFWPAFALAFIYGTYYFVKFSLFLGDKLKF